MSIPNSDYQFVGVNHLELIHIGSWPGGCCPAATAATMGRSMEVSKVMASWGYPKMDDLGYSRFRKPPYSQGSCNTSS